MSQNKSDTIRTLCEDFRRQLETFYAALKLAPPYHSVERAVLTLTNGLKAMGQEERARLLLDQTLLWAEYRKAFIESGLSQKHRGIISRLAQANRITSLPPEHEHFLSTYLQ
jgi:hypothetical protein